MAAQVTQSQTAMRVCLKCNKKFRSRGPENRICPPCTQVNRSLAQMPEICLAKQRGRKRHNGNPIDVEEECSVGI